jgi:hypothetical protein
MSVPSYEVMFGKLQLHYLFEDYFDQVGNMTSRIMLKALGKILMSTSLLQCPIEQVFVFFPDACFSPFNSTLRVFAQLIAANTYSLTTIHVSFFQ